MGTRCTANRKMCQHNNILKFVRNKIISIINQKGGVGKTSTAVNVSAELAHKGYSTLLIDLDPQGNAGASLGISNISKTIYDSMVETHDINDVIIYNVLDNLDVIGADVNLVAVDIEFGTIPNREYILKKTLAKLNESYEFIIIDCSPSLNLLSINSMVASQYVLIPVQCEYLALEGLTHLLNTVKLVQDKNLNPELNLLGILLTMYDKRVKLAELIAEDIRSCLKDLVFDTMIPRTVRIAEAPSHGKAVIFYDPKCIGAVSYMRLVEEILARLEIKKS